MVDEHDEARTHVDGVAPQVEDPLLEGRLPDGTEIEGYVIDGVLGKGGMGIVYSATHNVIGKRAAIKVLRTEVSNNPISVERFIQEARAVNKIGHANIIDIFDFGRLPDGRAYHLMDLMAGESLRKRLRRGALHPSEAASVIDDVTSALMAAHDKGFIHRDLKPDNVYLIEQAEGWPLVKLLDFGLAKLMPEAGTAAFITKTGVMLGTPEYMSPEQARGEPVDYRTDVYALGIMMFEILAGQRPFPSPGDAFLMLQYHADEPPPSLGSILPELPAEMIQLVDAMLAKEPAARPSLAAVRTVIKRLRTTQLPTRSVAGLELASLSNPSLSARPLGSPQGIRSSQLGAAPDVPGHEAPMADAPRVGRRPAPTPLTTPQLKPTTIPPGDAAASLDPEVMATVPRNAPRPSQPPEAAGLAGWSSPGHGSTTLGVPPPPRAAYAARPATPPPRTSNAWLIVGALLAIGAGIVLALVLTNAL